MIQGMEAAYEAKNFRALLDLTCGSNHSDVCRAWALTMTACYGPVGLHNDYTDAETGRPTAECLSKFPRVTEAMEKAWADLGALISWKSTVFA